MFHLTCSNQIDRLTAALAAHVLRCRAEGDPLAPVQIVVPNANVESYVRRELARQNGIAANLEVYFLQNFVSHALLGSHPNLRLLDAEALTGLFLALFLDERRLAQPALQPVRKYLEEVERQDARDVRRCQLATKLAHLFEEYSFSRGGMLADWRQGRQPLEGDEVAAWQRSLWRELGGRGGLLAELERSSGSRWLTLPELLEENLPLAAAPCVQVFGFSYVARVFHNLFARLAKTVEVRWYALAPTDAAAAIEDTAVALWARPGRESMKLLSQLAGDEVTYDFAAEPEGRMPLPPSVRVFAAGGARREAEAVASEIWTMLQESEHAPASGGARLRLSDIAVLVGGGRGGDYLMHLEAALRECHALPYQMVGASWAAGSSVRQAAELLLALPLGKFTRPEVAALLTHPNVLARFPEAKAESWISLCDRLGILRGADRADLAQTYVKNDLFNWDQGLRRLALGAFMAGEASGEKRAFALDGERYLPEESSDEASAWAFLALTRSLLADARRLASESCSLAEWVRRLTTFFTIYVVARDERQEQERLACLKAIESLDGIVMGSRAVSYRIVHELLTTRLQAISSRQRSGPPGGVVLSTLAAWRALPFRVVFLLGLGEGEFPRDEPSDSLDVRRLARQVGDVTPREDECYAFWETLGAARERLYLSYTSRSELTGDPLAPSPLLQEVERWLVQQRGVPGQPIEERHPLRRYDVDIAAQLGATNKTSQIHAPAAVREIQALAWRDALQTLLGADKPFPDLARLRRELPAAVWPALAEWLGLAPPPLLVAQTGDLPTPRLTRRSLVRFLECPLQGWAKHVLGLAAAGDDQEADASRFEDEPFSTRGWQRSSLLQGALQEAMRENRPLEEVYDAWAWRARARARVPAGFFATAEREEHLSVLRGWQSELVPLIGAARRLEWLRFGAAREHQHCDRVLPPLLVDLPSAAPLSDSFPPAQVEIVGEITPLAEAGLVLLRDTVFAKKGNDNNKLRRLMLRAFVDSLLLAAAGEPAPRAALLCFANRTFKWTIAPIDGAAARDYLALLAADMLRGPHAYWLPCEAVFTAWDKKGSSIASCIEALAENAQTPFNSTSSQYGPLRHPERFASLSEEEARVLAERRLDLFRRMLQPAGAASGEEDES